MRLAPEDTDYIQTAWDHHDNTWKMWITIHGQGRHEIRLTRLQLDKLVDDLRIDTAERDFWDGKAVPA